MGFIPGGGAGGYLTNPVAKRLKVSQSSFSSRCSKQLIFLQLSEIALADNSRRYSYNVQWHQNPHCSKMFVKSASFKNKNNSENKMFV